jgi:hypothetical protein
MSFNINHMSNAAAALLVSGSTAVAVMAFALNTAATRDGSSNKQPTFVHQI